MILSYPRLRNGWFGPHPAGLFMLGLLCGWPVNASSQVPVTSGETSLANPHQIPAIYQPVSQPPRWNSNLPALAGSPEDASRIRTVAPQWLSRFLFFPSIPEISENMGVDDPIIRDKAVNSIRQTVSPSILPEGFPERLIPLARWGQLHEDWRRYGGIDLYITKFTVSNLTVLVAESAAHVIVVARDSTFNPRSGQAALRQTAFDYAHILLSATFIPDVPDDLKTLRQGPSPLFLYGYYTTRLNKLTGQDDRTTLTETTDSANALSVRFFTNGQMSAFMALKSVDDPRELGNPFEPRFALLPGRRVDSDPFARPTDPTSPGERQLEEYIGLLLSPKEQKAFLRLVPTEKLERAFLSLSREQQISMVRLKMTDEYLAAGMRAFLESKYEDAIQYWLRNMQLEPENPRVGLLLNLAMERRVEQAYGGDKNRARADSLIFQATKSIRDQEVLLKKREETREIVVAKERAIVDHRTRALQAMAEGNPAESLQQWEGILRLDPGNTNALVFRELVRDRVEKNDHRNLLRQLPGANAESSPPKQQP